MKVRFLLFVIATISHTFYATDESQYNGFDETTGIWDLSGKNGNCYLRVPVINSLNRAIEIKMFCKQEKQTLDVERKSDRWFQVSTTSYHTRWQLINSGETATFEIPIMLIKKDAAGVKKERYINRDLTLVPHEVDELGARGIWEPKIEAHTDRAELITKIIVVSGTDGKPCANTDLKTTRAIFF